jgi:hypothetical protein
MLVKVISGGQTGADLGALTIAKQHGLKTGGWMPKGFLNQKGKHPEYAELYGMKEHPTSKRYPPRTALNVKESDGTLRIAANFNSAGEVLTMQMIDQYKKPHLDVDALIDDVSPNDVANWIKRNGIKILNVAGNSEWSCPGIGEFTIAFLDEVFRCYAGSTTPSET